SDRDWSSDVCSSDLFDLAADERTIAAAIELAEPQWQEVLADDDELAALVAEVPGGLHGLLESTGELLDSYFALEDPRRLEPAERSEERRVGTEGGGR